MAAARGRIRAGAAGALAVLLLLAGCGGGPVRGRLASPAPLNAADYRAPGIPAGFGDTKPVKWGTLAPDSYPVHGIDAARFQGKINWFSARAAGVNFAWLKSTEGGDRVDPGIEANMATARAAGVAVGAYHFYYFCRPAAEQAQWFIANTPRQAGDLPPALDMEWNHASRSCRRHPPAAQVRADIRTFAALVTRRFGTAPVIYTTPDFYEDNDLGQLQGYDFWLRSVAAHPSEVYPQERWTFWQYSGSGVVPGVGGIVDLNTFAGSPAQWIAWLTARQQR